MSERNLQTFDMHSALHVAQQLYEEKQYNECAEVCAGILSVDKTRADVWNLAGIVMLELQKYESAIEYFTHAAECDPKQSNHRLNLAESYRRSGNPTQAIKLLTTLLQENSAMENSSTFHFNLAKAYSDIEDSQSSIVHYTMAIKLDPNDLGAMFNLANAQVSLKHFGEAIELYIHALSKGYLDAGVNLAHTYAQIGLFSEALEVYRAIYDHYKFDSDFLFNYANALNYANADVQHTQALYQQSIALNPSKVEYCINYAHFLLKYLQLQQGFRIYEERKRLAHMLPQGLSKVWRGEGAEDLSQKNVLIYHEQGLGDSIMFSRFIPLLMQRAKSVQILIQEPLSELFRGLGLNVINSISEAKDYDMALSLLSSPLVLGLSGAEDLEQRLFSTDNLTRLKSLLKDKGLLDSTISESSLDSETKSSSKAFKKIKVGICFCTDSAFPDAEAKNIPPKELMKALSEFVGQKIEVHSLTKAACEGLDKLGVIPHALNDFIETCAVIEEMDMVISIDTAVAHLSASMGKHTLVLLHKRYDWRWGNGVMSPWYESVVCMTQSHMGRWDDVAQNVCAYLRGYLRAITL